jgi:hypothetical protein
MYMYLYLDSRLHTIRLRATDSPRNTQLITRIKIISAFVLVIFIYIQRNLNMVQIL